MFWPYQDGAVQGSSPGYSAPAGTVLLPGDISPGQCTVPRDCSNSAQSQGVRALRPSAEYVKLADSAALQADTSLARSTVKPGWSGWQQSRDALNPTLARGSPMPVVKEVRTVDTSPASDRAPLDR